MFNIEAFIKTFSYLGIFAIIFAESGLLIGIVLPGDSLLFIAGFLASQHILNIFAVIVVVFIAAVAGDNTGYYLGKRFGPDVFKRHESRFFKPEMVDKAEDFYKRHGGKTIILSRFTPIVRTIAPLLAGVGEMNYRLFFIYNIIGAALWAIGVTLLGYFLGSVIPNVDHYLLPGVAIVVLISLAPSLWHFLRQRRKK